MKLKLLSILLAGTVLLAGCGMVTSTTEKETETKKEAEKEEEKPEQEELSDTIRWFNASYAILTERNSQDYTVYGGVPATSFYEAAEKAMLDRDWGVTDRASADEKLDWAFQEGHRAEFVDDMEYLKEELGFDEMTDDERLQLFLDYFDISAEEAALYTDQYAAYEKQGEDAISAWDYSRALNLCSFYYIAGYYTKEEAFDKSLEIAKTAQSKFSSWDEFVESYMLGYEYWADEPADDREEIYETLLEREDNPYAVDFQAELVKTW